MQKNTHTHRQKSRQKQCGVQYLNQASFMQTGGATDLLITGRPAQPPEQQTAESAHFPYRRHHLLMYANIPSDKSNFR